MEHEWLDFLLAGERRKALSNRVAEAPLRISWGDVPGTLLENTTTFFVRSVAGS